MAAYVVMIKDETLDKDELATYSQKAGAARGDHHITPLAFYGDLEVLEGRDAEGVVVLQFEDAEAAKAGTSARPTRSQSASPERRQLPRTAGERRGVMNDVTRCSARVICGAIPRAAIKPSAVNPA